MMFRAKLQNYKILFYLVKNYSTFAALRLVKKKHMIDYIKGTVAEILPTEMTLECHGIGYKILISLQSFEELKTKSEATVYIHHYLREDDEQYFGFATKDERELFRLLIGVSGVGAATARMMLSSMSPEELRNAILSEDINRIKSIKGIGLKSAQRLILELKDKVTKGGGTEQTTIFQTGGNPNVEEATTALVMLGFTKPNVTKAIAAVLKETPDATLEQLIKMSLKKL